MHKDITFLDGVTLASRQKVLNFVKNWNSKDEWIEVETSGSTGKPKTIKLSKDRMRASASATATFFDLKPEQTILLALSVEYIAGKMMLIRAMEHKLNIVVAPIKSNPLDLKIEMKIDFSAFVPMQVQTILSKERSRKNYESISNVIIGGAVINKSLENKLQKLSNNNFSTFGMTETISHIALRNITDKEIHYTALPNVSFSTTKNDCLTINAPNVCDEKLITTDCVELLNNHQFIWKGRVDFVINSGGVKIYPEEIEKKILHLLPRNRYYFMGIKDDLLGEKTILKVEGDSDITITKLKVALSKFEMPKEIVFVPKFSETLTGKIKRL